VAASIAGIDLLGRSDFDFDFRPNDQFLERRSNLFDVRRSTVQSDLQQCAAL
jgi:hypothetical protein